MKIVFRVNGGTREVPGLGHVMRCLALALSFKLKGYTSLFVCYESKSAFSLIEKAGFSYLSLPHNCPIAEDSKKTLEVASGANFIIVDSYDLKEEYLRLLRNCPSIVVYFDDLLDRQLPVDVVIGNAYTTIEDYQGKILPETKVLAGPSYTPLRKEFHHPSPHTIREEITSLLITLGGHDPENATEKVVSALRAYPKMLNVHLLLGKAYEHFESLQNALENYPHPYFIHRDVQNVLPLFQQVDLAISAGGITVWELASVGVPMVLIKIADNQERTVNFIKEQGLAYVLGDVVEGLNSLESKEVRAKLSKQLQALIDGKGVLNLTDALINLSKELLKVCEIKITPYMQESTLLWQWRNDPVTRAMSKKDHVISLEEHQKWLGNLKDSHFLFGFVNLVPIGVVRLDDSLVSINVNPQFRGKKLGEGLLKKACEYATHTLQLKKLHAEIKKENVASIKIFEKVGFRLQSEKDGFLSFDYQVGT